MPSKEQKRISRKKDRHRKKVALDRKKLDQKLRNRYPTFVPRNDADPSFIELIMTACRRLNFDDRAKFSRFERQLYRILRSDGKREAFEFVNFAKSEMPNSARAIDHQIMFNLGQQVFSLVDQESLRQFLPYNDVTFVIGNGVILAYFRALESRVGKGGTIHHSPNPPVLEINGWNLKVGFSRHAIDRICSRLNPDFLDYAASGDIFALFSQCRHFEYVELPDGSPAFSFYDHCIKGFRSFEYVEEVLGMSDLPEGTNAYYRLGYCPVAIDPSGFCVAKTFLHPGFKNTQENLLIRQIRDKDSRQRARDFAENLQLNYLRYEDGIKVVKWYHDLGIPQVVLSEENFFSAI